MLGQRRQMKQEPQELVQIIFNSRFIRVPKVINFLFTHPKLKWFINKELPPQVAPLVIIVRFVQQSASFVTS
jgi:hypothetical protein